MVSSGLEVVGWDAVMFGVEGEERDQRSGKRSGRVGLEGEVSTSRLHRVISREKLSLSGG